MTRDIDTLVRYLLVVVVIASVCATAVPILYSTGPWRAKKLGRLFMLQAVTIAFALDVTVLFQFWHPKDILWVFWIEVVIYTMIAYSTAMLAWMSWRLNHPKRTKGKRRRPVMLFTDQVYRWLKFIAQIFLPALGTLYFTVAQIWHLPDATEVVGTIVALDTFLGVLLGISTKTFNDGTFKKYDGELVLENNEEGSGLRLANVDPRAIESKDELTFKLHK